MEGGRHDHCWLELQISRYLDISIITVHHCSASQVSSISSIFGHNIIFYASPSPGLSWCLCLKWSKAYYFNIHSLSTKWNANSRSAKDPNKTSQLLLAVATVTSDFDLSKNVNHPSPKWPVIGNKSSLKYTFIYQKGTLNILIKQNF